MSIIIMSSILIIGATPEQRKEKAQEKCSLLHISRFDVTEITGETSIGIAQVRELEHGLRLKPLNSEVKAVIVHPAELLTVEAQNALLKNLEETSDNTIIILTAPQVDFLLPTIVSRCQIIKLSSKSEIILSDDESNALYKILNTMYQSGAGERLKIAGQIAKNKDDIRSWLVTQLYFWRKILLLKCHPGKPASAEGPQWDSSPDLIGIRMTPIQIVTIIKNLEKTRTMIDQNVNPRLALEVFLLDLPKVSS